MTLTRRIVRALLVLLTLGIVHAIARSVFGITGTGTWDFYAGELTVIALFWPEIKKCRL
jgi:hypothetical protein